MPKLTIPSKDYNALRKEVEETLLLGRQKIEEAKVQTYWRTGKLISDHILSDPSRAAHYGEQVVAKLSEDLEVSRDVLWRCIKFARSFKKIVAAPPQSSLTWTHYTKLITVKDEKTRNSLMRRAVKSHWSSDYLAQKIDEETDPSPQKPTAAAGKPAYPKLIARRGELYTYRLIASEQDGGVSIDLGFRMHQQLPDGAKGFKQGQIVESLKADRYSLKHSSREEKSLFTYQAKIERIVDGDTLYVDVDLGFGSGVYQYLRLRGIDCPELSTDEGRKAKAFVEQQLKGVPHIILTSSRSDKYDRYVADVYIPAGDGEKDVYLNDLLLQNGHAVRWG